MKPTGIALVLYLAATAAAFAAAPQERGDAERGAALYDKRCTACHSIDTNRIGPSHRGVFGRAAGSVPGYDYSEALSESSTVWTVETLNRWLANPQALIPGQKMGFRLRKADERRDIIAYLKSLTPAARHLKSSE